MLDIPSSHRSFVVELASFIRRGNLITAYGDYLRAYFDLVVPYLVEKPLILLEVYRAVCPRGDVLYRAMRHLLPPFEGPELVAELLRSNINELSQRAIRGSDDAMLAMIKSHGGRADERRVANIWRWVVDPTLYPYREFGAMSQCCEAMVACDSQYLGSYLTHLNLYYHSQADINDDVARLLLKYGCDVVGIEKPFESNLRLCYWWPYITSSLFRTRVLYALVVMVHDDYYRHRAYGITVGGVGRFLAITRRLPSELQARICSATYGYGDAYVPRDKFEEALTWVVGYL